MIKMDTNNNSFNLFNFSIFLNIILTITNAVVRSQPPSFQNTFSNDFLSVPTTVKTTENDTVLLPCYHNSPFKYIRWIRDDILLIDSETRRIPRITLFSNGSLQVSNVRSEDTGEYVCEMTSPNGLTATQVHAIEVLYPPTVHSNPNGIIEIAIGSVFEIVCDAQGTPQPVITWRHYGKPESNQIDNLRRYFVEVSSKEVAGPIDCIATNGVGEPAVAGVNLIVLFPPEVKVDKPIIHTKIMMRAFLECHVIAAPAATVHWFHHGVPVPQDTRVGRIDTDNNSNSTAFQYYASSKHVLVIKKVKETDLGMYECRAENRLGFKGAVIDLTGRPMPSTFKTSPLASTPMTHNLIWQTESLSEIIEYKLKFRQVPSGNITPNNRYNSIEWNELVIPAGAAEGPIYTIGYILRGLQPASVYEVAVISRNRYGWSDISKIIRFATGGEIEVPNLSTETIDYDQLEDNFITDSNTISSNMEDYPGDSGSVKTTISIICTVLMFLNLINIF